MLADTNDNVRTVAVVFGVIVAIGAMVISLMALKRARSAERRASYPRDIDIELNWRGAPSPPAEPDSDEGHDDLADGARENSLRLAITSSGEMRFADARARVHFRRPYGVRRLSTPWVPIQIPAPQPDSSGEYKTYASHAFAPHGQWSVNEVGLRLGLLTTTESGLDRAERVVQRILTGTGRDLWAKDAVLIRALRLRPAFSIEQAAITPAGPEPAHDTLRARVLRRIDRRSPRRRIRVTVVFAWRVVQYGGEVVKRKQRHTYRLDFGRSPRIDWVEAHHFSGATCTQTKIFPDKYPRHLPARKRVQG
ncbi:hypothetical protein [Streptomyces sp. NPDC005077]|uniref:hypothetical protein n=1 Tax=Streptomyces sp. NPDC005077 TaxID=3154292 RepID=UPI0033B2925D